MAVFDWCVHSPPQTVIHALQKSVRYRPDHWLNLDGRIGPRTLAALNTFASSHTVDSLVALGMVEKRLLFLARLVQRSPERRLKYLRGWMKRCYWLGIAIMEGQLELDA
jgi:lysozyme family protein